MLLRRRLQCVLLSALLAAPPALHAQADPADYSRVPDIIRVCTDENDFPPFTFFRDTTVNQPDGFNIALIDRILTPIGKRAEYDVMPWRRCLAMAERGEVDVLLDVQDTPERRRIMLLPSAHYETSPAMIALADNRHLMQLINSKERMLTLNICRITGWDTSILASADELIPAGEPHDLTSALAMLRQGRCDMLIYTAELLSGGLHTGVLDQDDFEDVTFHLMPWRTEGIPKYFGVSRNAGAAQAIHDLLDHHIQLLRGNGELAGLLANYFPADSLPTE